MKEHINFSDETVVSASPTQVSSNLGNEFAILNFETGMYHSLDEVGARVWELMQAPITLSNLRTAILADYTIDEATCDADLKELLQSLASAGLLEVQHGQTA